MTAMRPDLDSEELRDIIHGTYVIVHLVRSKYRGDLEGFDTILANVKRYLDGDNTLQSMGAWGIVSDGTPEGGADPARNAVANLGEATAYATEGSTVAIEHVIQALRCALSAGVKLETIEYLLDHRRSVIRRTYTRLRAQPDWDINNIDYEAIDAEINAKAIFRPGFDHRWSMFRDSIRAGRSSVVVQHAAAQRMTQAVVDARRLR